MAGNTYKAVQAVRGDKDLHGRVKDAADAGAKRQVLADAGHSGFTPDQAEPWRKAQQGVELNDDDMRRIAGGENTSTIVSNAVSQATVDVCEDVADAFA